MAMALRLYYAAIIPHIASLAGCGDEVRFGRLHQRVWLLCHLNRGSLDSSKKKVGPKALVVGHSVLRFLGVLKIILAREGQNTLDFIIMCRHLAPLFGVPVSNVTIRIRCRLSERNRTILLYQAGACFVHGPYHPEQS